MNIFTALETAALHKMNNTALLRAVADNATSSQQALVQLFMYLGEVEVRSLHAAEGYSSLFAYCRSLGYSEGEAYRRCAVARAGRNYLLCDNYILTRDDNYTLT
jgi:hypothetical protein